MLDELRIRAPELHGGEWLNSDRPLRLDPDLRGKLVLLEFWTYCCINCQHVLPEVRRLERKHADALVVIGVHSAKFTNEQDADSVRQAVLRHDIEHPVVTDPERQLWSRYAVSSWPTFVLIDPHGYILGRLSGEGHEATLDTVIGEQAERFRDRGELDITPVRFALERERRERTPTPALAFPGGVLADPAGDRMFVSDTGNHRVVVATAGGRVEAVIGDGKAGAVDGGFASARFRGPRGLALAGETLYVADTDNHLVRAIDLARRQVTTVAGGGALAPSSGAGATTPEVELNSPWDVVVIERPSAGGAGSDRLLYVAMAGSHQIWTIDLRASIAAMYAGNGGENLHDGLRTEACLAQPSGVATDGERLYIADSEVSAIRVIELAAEKVSTLIGQGLFVFGDRDGHLQQALLQHPLGVAFEQGGEGGVVFVADTYNHKVKEIDIAAGTVRTVAGIGHAAFADGKPGGFREPGAVSVLGRRLLVADTNNHAVRSVDRDTGEVSTLVLEGLSLPSA